MVYRSHKCYAVTYDPEYDILVACSDDGKTRVSNEKGSNVLIEYDSTPAHHTAVLISRRHSAIFFGTNLGSIRAFLWPFTEFTKDGLEYIEFPVHQSAVTSIKISHDATTLITGGEDGSIFLLKIKEFLDGQDATSYDVLNAISTTKKRDLMGKYINTYLLNNLALVGRANMDVKHLMILCKEFREKETRSRNLSSRSRTLRVILKMRRKSSSTTIVKRSRVWKKRTETPL